MLTVAGWLAAVLGSSLALAVWRERSARTEAIARACHELRGPIAAARLGLQLGARTGELSPDRLRAIDLELGRAGLALQDLTGESGNVAPAPPRFCEQIDIAELLADSVEAWRATAGAAECSIRTCWTGGSAFLLGDRFRLAQATGNLIANAIEHGGGAIEVRGRCSPAGIRIEVTDDGPGLSAPLAQLARAARRRRGGRGRGLAIVRSIVQAHGGHLAAAPAERGARLVIELPAAPSEEGMQA
jgi:signal transduction histidine kinase